MTLSTRLFRKLSGASLLLALAVPAGLSAQPPRNNPDAGVAGEHADGPRGERGPRGRGEGRRGGGHHGRQGGGQHGDVMRQLNLTDAQQAQLRTIREETRARAEQLRGSGDREANRAQMRALHEETRRRVDAVLTPAQRQQAEALRAQARTEHVARRVTHLRETLGLNESQTTRVQRVFEQAASRRHAARDAGANTTPEARRTAARAQREQVDSELRQILTAEQMTQLEAERANHRGRQGGRGHGRQGGHHGPADGQRGPGGRPAGR
ncbi:MAG: Spy/CpxP family protein refolding chaperone [Sandaracinaceae bacterium]|jgi:Spy/CpxP family protein refolding chaperone|nr:Spy/CpxP family protein refolding chaperone [Sandaracinaceae bacterium]MBK8407900.1 Spy/CpxP family protein refolding chaperone [Sandaracinaceae bacterium]MBP7683783.1 Spy/CpxP family protein refolding chaperone [Deltaproteobacteria bacterium]